MRYHIDLFSLTLTFALFTPTALASTAAFQGKVTEVESTNQVETIVRFTVSIDYYDYCSWGNFNRDSKTGELITRQTKRLGTAAMIDGRLVNVGAFSKAIKPGQWGYFYEDTWLDLRTTPDFQWGDVVDHDPQQRKLTLRIHKTHKAIHLEANPPQNVELQYESKTTFRLEDKPTTAEEALAKGSWVQIHAPRKQIVNVWSAASAFNPKELLPQAEGKRGSANDLTAPAVLLNAETKTPEQVIDLWCKMTVSTQEQGGSVEKSEITSNSVSFVLDGKLCPAGIAAANSRHVVLGYYRNQTKPHKIFVRSHDDAIRGRVKVVDGARLVVTTSEGKDEEVKLQDSAAVRLDGVDSNYREALKEGSDVTVFPQRGATIISFGRLP